MAKTPETAKKAPSKAASKPAKAKTAKAGDAKSGGAKGKSAAPAETPSRKVAAGVGTAPGVDAQALGGELAELRRRQPRFRGLEAGHRACQGCGEALGARLVMEAAGPDVMVANATGCLEVFTTPWPQSAWRVPWIHSLFENAAAVASGMEAALKARGHRTKVMAFGGDGSTFDIGFQALSGMLERTHNVLYVCFDNEAYMNTGIQRSSSTPHAAATTTSPAGSQRMGKRHLKKDLLQIIAAHHVPYAASASVAYAADLRRKVRRAIEIEGPTFLLLHVPCPLGWGHDGAKTIEIARLAVQTGLFPVVELERNELAGVMPIRQPRPVSDYLKLQNRFRHLFGNDHRARQEREHLQALADHNIATYHLLGEEPDPLDTEGADTVRRGGLIA
ncbi:thiamine pyrophosphate-dependent enzyme [Roseospirillum parvum]|uniref:Pyruvate ferredoxin oxidoreductase beta subunit n=1 Tax=Roseospirillum parvum TaxID=83401 RepID=A0A1G7XJH8_9PROT|nr:thiamine pyrophosphate-dependent enzyme [Roseospirillum parvum]SDG84266.1 pyruvate ferredoxin oxidoreductase beta subunit [Roseospirillum parvum]